MPWRGESWLVETSSLNEALPPVTSPMPVRFPASLLTTQAMMEGTSEDCQWLLGLVIHSYVMSDRLELMYVILLDDGRECHLACGQVERIAILKQWETGEDFVQLNDDSIYRLPRGHASSMEKENDSITSVGSFYSTLLRSCSGGSDNLQCSKDQSDVPPNMLYADAGSTDCVEECRPCISRALPILLASTFEQFFHEVVHDAMALSALPTQQVSWSGDVDVGPSMSVPVFSHMHNVCGMPSAATVVPHGANMLESVEASRKYVDNDCRAEALEVSAAALVPR